MKQAGKLSGTATSGRFMTVPLFHLQTTVPYDAPFPFYASPLILTDNALHTTDNNSLYTYKHDSSPIDSCTLTLMPYNDTADIYSLCD